MHFCDFCLMHERSMRMPLLYFHLGDERIDLSDRGGKILARLSRKTTHRGPRRTTQAGKRYVVGQNVSLDDKKHAKLLVVFIVAL